ncbi:MAG TPA: porin [Flavobacteriales bacterium]|nr:porin [Flavobacteriales bacterium]
MRLCIIIVFAVFYRVVDAQDTTKKNPLTFSGYVEVYYSYDLSNPDSHERPFFFYNFNRHNELNCNLGFLDANYATDYVRANFSLMAGTYAQYNLAGEQGLLKNVYEANAGFKLSRKKDVWLDAGIMPSHIGFESAIGKDCWTLSRSLCAENSPYYQSGVKLSYTSLNNKWYLSVKYLTGWQRIQRVPGNHTPAFGTQIGFKPSSNVTLNWCTYAGNEQPDTMALWRYFNHLHGIFQLTEKFGITTGFDIGFQQHRDSLSKIDGMSNWYTPVVIFQFKPSAKIRIAARGEYYVDEDGVIIPTGTKNGFKTLGYSINLDYLPVENAMLRFEARGLSSEDKIFMLDNKPSTMNYFFTTSLAVSF